MKPDKKSYLFIFLIIAAVILFVVFFPFRPIPDGLPNDYYDRIEVLEDNNVDLYVYSDDIDFNGDYDYFKVFSINDLSHPNSGHMNVLVLDMNKNIQNELATEEQIRRLYEVNFFTIIFVNYESSGSSQYDHFIDFVDLNSDMITFSYDAFGNGFSGSNSGDLPSCQMLMYAILHEIVLIVEENKQMITSNLR